MVKERTLCWTSVDMPRHWRWQMGAATAGSWDGVERVAVQDNRLHAARPLLRELILF